MTIAISILFSRYVLLVVFVLTIALSSRAGVQAFDATFTPANPEDESIPLSAKYRHSLRKLCKLLADADASSSIASLPPDLRDPVKKAQMEKKCAKLKEDDLQGDEADGRAGQGWGFGQRLRHSSPRALFTVIGLGAGLYAWRNGGRRIEALRGIGGRGGTVGGPTPASIAADMREARMKRFAAANANAPSVNVEISPSLPGAADLPSVISPTVQ